MLTVLDICMPQSFSKGYYQSYLLNSLWILMCFVGEFKLNIECNHATLAGHIYVLILVMGD